MFRALFPRKWKLRSIYECTAQHLTQNLKSDIFLRWVCHLGATEVAQMSFVNAGRPSAALSSLIRSLFKLSTRSFEFAASAVMNSTN